MPNIRSLLNVGFYQDRKDMLWWKGVYNKKEQEKVERWKNKFPSYIASLQYYKVHDVLTKEKNELELDNRLMEVSYEAFIQKPEDVVDKILNFVGLSKDRRIQEYLGQNEIYNQNRKEDYYISPEKDDKILEVAVRGLS